MPVGLPCSMRHTDGDGCCADPETGITGRSRPGLPVKGRRAGQNFLSRVVCTGPWWFPPLQGAGALDVVQLGSKLLANCDLWPL
jgi:hypothetical protein